MAYDPSTNVILLLNKRLYEKQFSIREKIFNGRFQIAQNLYRKDLFGHYGCVNAIEFSNEGELLISGGDDRRVLLWSVSPALEGQNQPAVMRATHISNIFCLSFDSTNTKIFSAGNDDQVIVHDTRTGGPLDYFLHNRPVYGISLDPTNDSVFTSAGDDGRILLYDLREPSKDPLCLAKYKTSFHAVMYNPVDSRLLATANSKEGISLWDTRRPRQPALRYGNDHMQSGMSVRWNSTGNRLLALRRRLPPVLYALNQSEHLCQFYHSGYYNSCTMKSCCFAGDNDQYVLSGSDDFNLYMWRINESDFEFEDWEGSAHLVLTGHRSIVNQVRYNTQHCVIASSGVEKMVKLWSPLERENWKGGLEKEIEPENPRDVFSHEEYISLVQRSGQFMSHDYSHQSTLEDSRMMAFFDSLVQREIEGWLTDRNTSNTDDSELEPHSDSDSESVSSLSSSPEPSQVQYNNNQTDSYQHQNRIAQLIAQKRPQLVRLAQHRSKNSKYVYRKKRPKLKSILKKPKRNRKLTSRRNKNHKMASTGSSSSGTVYTSNNLSPTLVSPRIMTRSYTRNNKARSGTKRRRDSDSSDQASSLDAPSTSTGITRRHGRVYRFVEQDSEDETVPVSRPEHPPALVNIVPTPLNGSHVDTPVRQSSEDEISNESSNSSTTALLNNQVTPDVKSNGGGLDLLTPDSGIACGSVPRPLNIDDGSDDDWIAMETFKSRVKKARHNYRNHIGDSDSN